MDAATSGRIVTSTIAAVSSTIEQTPSSSLRIEPARTAE